MNKNMKKNISNDKRTKNSIIIISIVMVVIIIIISLCMYLSKQKTYDYLSNQSMSFCEQLYNYTPDNYNEIYNKVLAYMALELRKEYTNTIINNKQLNDGITRNKIISEYIYVKTVSVKDINIDYNLNGISVVVLGHEIHDSIKDILDTESIITTTINWVQDSNGEWKIYNFDMQSDDTDKH